MRQFVLLATVCTVILCGMQQKEVRGATTYFAFDEGRPDPEDNERLPCPNSEDAYAAFLSELIGIGVEDLEDEVEDLDDEETKPADGETLEFPGEATEGGLTKITDRVFDFVRLSQGTIDGTYPISGDGYLRLSAEPARSIFSIAFDAPVEGFGFFGTDIAGVGSSAGTFGFKLDNGTTVTFDKRGPELWDASVMFAGVIDPGNPFTEVAVTSLLPADSPFDLWGVDDITIGSRAVPEPSIVMLCSQLGALAAFLCWRRRRRA